MKYTYWRTVCYNRGSDNRVKEEHGGESNAPSSKSEAHDYELIGEEGRKGRWCTIRVRHSLSGKAYIRKK